MEFLGVGKGPRIRTAGVGAEAGGVAFIAQVANEEVFLGMLEVKAGFERTELHHS